MSTVIKAICYIELLIISCLLTACIITIIKNIRYILGKEKLKKYKEIRQPKGYLYGGLFAIIILFILNVLCVLSILSYDLERAKETVYASLFIFVCFLGAVYILLLSLNWEIRLYENYFTHTSFLGITRTYRYDAISENKSRAAYRYYWKGHPVFSIGFLQPNYESLSAEIRRFHWNRFYRLPMKERKIDSDALRQKETLWLETASSNDKILYEDLVRKLKKEEDAEFFLSDLTVEVNDPMIFPVLEETLFQWEDKKLEAIVVYIIGDKNNKDSFEKIISTYKSLSPEERQRYSLLYDKAISSTITKESVLKKCEWLYDWRSINNLPKTIRKIAKWEIPEVTDIWHDVFTRKNRYNEEYYQFEDAQKSIEKIITQEKKKTLSGGNYEVK